MYNYIANFSPKIFGFTKGVRLATALFPKNRLYFGNSSLQTDGFGAQLQRIFSIKAFADVTNTKFTLEDLTYVEDQIIDKIIPNEELNIKLKRLNNWIKSLFNFYRYSDNYCKVICDSRMIFLVLIYQRLKMIFHKKILVILMEDAYPYTNHNPDIYSEIILEPSQSQHDVEIKIDLHLRLVNFSKNSERYLDPIYYLNKLKEITRNLDNLSKNYRINIHSDFGKVSLENDFRNITPGTLDYLRHIQVLDSENQIDLDLIESAIKFQNSLKILFKNVVIDEDENLIDALESMRNSDYLILSKSSFAFVGGVLNRKGKIYSPRYWNNCPSNWSID